MASQVLVTYRYRICWHPQVLLS